MSTSRTISALNNSVTLKTWLGVVQDHCKWRRSIDLLSVGYCKYSSILHLFRVYLKLNNIVTLESRLGSLKVIGNGTIRKLWVQFPIRLPWLCVVLFSR